MIRFLHTADIHLDSPLRALEQYEGAPVEELRLATRKAFGNVIDTALEEKVQFVLISGDLYDGDLRDWQSALFFSAQMNRLDRAGIRAFLIAGNHDAQNVMTRRLPLPGNVRMFSAQGPETVLLEDLGVAIHGQSFETQHVAADIASGYPDPIPGLFNIGMLHTSADGRPDHDCYAPCSPLSLRGKGYDYWALGHVHRREILSENPHIVFPGNPQGRDIGEPGAKGCCIVEVSAGRRVDVRFAATDVWRWFTCELEAETSEPEDIGRSFEKALQPLRVEAEGRHLAVRVRLRTTPVIWARLGRALRPVLQNAALNAGGGQIWLERVVHEFVAEPTAAETAGGPLGEVAAVIRALRGDEDLMGELLSKMKLLGRQSLPSGCPDPGDAAVIRALLPEVEAMIVAAFRPAGGGR